LFDIGMTAHRPPAVVFDFRKGGRVRPGDSARDAAFAPRRARVGASGATSAGATLGRHQRLGQPPGGSGGGDRTCRAASMIVFRRRTAAPDAGGA